MKTTTDIYFAAALLSMGAKLEKTDKEDPRHMVFAFSSPTVAAAPVSAGNNTVTLPFKQVPTMDLDALENLWVNKTLQVNAYEFAEALKRMKSVVHSH